MMGKISKPRTWADYQTRYPKLLREAFAPLVTPAPTPIAIITATSLKSPEPPVIRRAPGDNRPEKDIRAEAEERETLSVAIHQPHRRAIRGTPIDASNADTPFARQSTPLGRLCIARKLRTECYQAGDEYAEVLRQAKAAMGLSVPYSPRGEGQTALTEDELQAMRDAARIRERKCNAILVGVHPRAARVLEMLCYDQRDICAEETTIAIRGLDALARLAFGLIDEGINRGKIGRQNEIPYATITRNTTTQDCN
jgi:hypothetical protein